MRRQCAAGSAKRLPRAPGRRRNAAIRAATSCSGRPDAKAEAPQDCVADPSRRDIAKAHAEHQRPGKMDAAQAAVDAALDVPRRLVAAGEEWGRPLPAIGHRRRKKARTDNGYADTVAHEARPERLGIGAQPGLACAIAGAGRLTAKLRNRSDRDAAALFSLVYSLAYRRHWST